MENMEEISIIMNDIFENKSLTNLKSIGEFGLIDRLTEDISLKNARSLYGVGDDAAIIDMGENVQVVSTDMLVEGIHFDMHYAPLKHVGYKAIAVNLSDIAAMNARPEQVLVSIAVSSRYSVEAMEELYDGMKLFSTLLKMMTPTSNTAAIKIKLYNSHPHENMPEPTDPYLNVSMMDVMGFR